MPLYGLYGSRHDGRDSSGWQEMILAIVGRKCVGWSLNAWESFLLFEAEMSFLTSGLDTLSAGHCMKPKPNVREEFPEICELRENNMNSSVHLYTCPASIWSPVLMQSNRWKRIQGQTCET